MAKVEFVKYVNDSEMLCSGVFYVKIDGKLISFNAWNNKKNDFPPFWECYGGPEHEGIDDDEIPKGPYHLARDLRNSDYPEEIQHEFSELLRIFNENVKWGSCRGCCSYV